MKKLLITTLALMLTLTACGKHHTEPPVPSEPGVTIAVTETTPPAETHTVTEASTEATEESQETASTETETKAETESPLETEHKHTYKSKVTKVPTCTASGVRTYTCAECGASYTEIIKPLDHAFVITTSEPTCTTSGCTTYKCKECGYTYTENIREALGHTYGPMVTVRNPTELEAGLAEHTCTRCGAKDTVVLPKLNPQP